MFKSKIYGILMFLPVLLFAQTHNRIIFLHHSTGGNVYNYPAKGVPQWFSEYNSAHGTNFQISDRWYPADNNMPIDYYQEWIDGTGLDSLTQDYDVIVWKHCYPASDVNVNTGNIDPSSSYQSIENYKAIYRLLRGKMDSFPDKIFIVWTIPPRHRLYGPSSGDTIGNAERARSFTFWVKDTFLNEDGEHPNIYIFDFRGIVADSDNLFLKYEYERSHTGTDSHPNDSANNVAGPQFAQFIVDAVSDFEANEVNENSGKNNAGFNVFRKVLYFRRMERDEKVIIYDRSGKILYTFTAARSGAIEMPVSVFRNGVYFYRILGNKYIK